MTAMIDIQALAIEIAQPAYAPFLPDSPGVVVDMLNAPTATAPRETFVNERTIFASMGLAAGPLLDKIDAFTTGAVPADPTAALLHNATKRAMKFVYSAEGLDFGHPNSQAQIDALAMIGVLTTAEAGALKALGIKPASRAEVLFGVGSRVTEDDVRAAQGV